MLAETRSRDARAAGGRGARALPNPGSIGPDVWLVVAITAVAGLLRFATITSQSFWVDEATTVHEVGLSFGQMLHELRLNETSPPLYFALAWVWTRIFGAGELGIRSLSAVAGVALVPAAYLCGRELVSRAAGVVAAALVAVSPFLIWYSQEARSYMVFALLGALSLLFAARVDRTRSRRELALWALCSALAILTHFFAGFLVAPEALWLLWRLRDRAALAGCAAVAAVQLAVLPLAISDTSHPLGWLQKLRLSWRIDWIPTDFGISQLYRSSSTPLLDGMLAAAALAAAAAALVAVGGGARERRGAGLGGGLGLLVVLVPVVLAWLGRDYVYSRNLIVAWVPLAVAVAAACAAPRARILGMGLALALVAGLLWADVSLSNNPWVQRPDWRGAAAALGQPSGPRLIVAEDQNAAEQPLSVYLPGTHFSYLGFPTSAPAVTVSEVDVVGDPAMQLRAPLPAEVRLLASTVVSVNIEVWRFGLQAGWTAPETVLAERVQALFAGATRKPSVLLQR